MNPGWKRIWFVWIILIFAVPCLQKLITERSRASVLKEDVYCQEEFRKQELLPDLYEEILVASCDGKDFGDILTTTMLDGNFFPEKVSFDSEVFKHFKSEEYRTLKNCYEAVWADISCFPVPSEDIYFEDGWMDVRNYGGTRFHEGTDLFGEITEPGYYPVLSMTDGTVEQIGWLPLGGYRIGIRSRHGGYFYYAHLSSYEKRFSLGDVVYAGDILGYMGNTGYGEEGTSGKFPVHLHLGIYIQTPVSPECSVNPYWVLKAMEKKIRKYTY